MIGNVQNPYKDLKPKNRLSLFQMLTDGIGATNYAGEYQYQQDMMQSQWDAEYNLALEDRRYNEEYNDPRNQVQRLRAAGLNPDLSGGVSAGDSQSSLAGNAAGAQTAVQAPSVSLAQVAEQTMQTLLSVVSGMTSLQDIFFQQDMQLMNPFIDAAKKESVDNFIASYKPEAIIKMIQGDTNSASDSFSDAAFSMPSYHTHNPLRSKRAKSYAETQLQAYLGNERFKQDVLETIKSRYSKIYDTHFEKGKIKATNDLIGNIGEGDKKAKDMSEVFGILAGGVIQADYSENKMRKASAKYETDFIGGLDDAQFARAINASNAQIESNAQIDSAQNEGYKQIFTGLAEASKNGNVWASIALVLYKAFAGNISIGGSSIMTPKGKSSSKSWNFGF